MEKKKHFRQLATTSPTVHHKIRTHKAKHVHTYHQQQNELYLVL